MLEYMHIKNIALIKELEIELGDGLNILTGETGAGKSIILGSINYVLGHKLKKDYIREGEDFALVECIFNIANSKERITIERLLAKYGVICSDELIISRKMTINGRSVFRINGEIVKQNLAKQLSVYLIDIHSQHEHQSLLRNDRQLELLDRYASLKTMDIYQKYLEKYTEYMELRKSIDEEYIDEEKRKRELAFLEFEINEIEEANLKIGEDIELEQNYEKFSKSREILNNLANISNSLYVGNLEESVTNSLSGLIKLREKDPSIENFIEYLAQLEDIIALLQKDIVNYKDENDNYEEELYLVTERLNIINLLKSKYGNSIEGIIKYKDDKIKEYEKLINYEENIKSVRLKIESSYEEIEKLSKEIYIIRKKAAEKLSKSITCNLKELDLKNAKFEIRLIKQENFSQTGKDKVSFEITTNKSSILRPINEVASGGELSRVMLAIKAILAEVDGVGTLVFDEIDTGISGHAAQQVAFKMKELSTKQQIICITHLPQITAMAKYHYLIQKEDTEKETLTNMKMLKEKESINELARMLSGAVITNTVIANAKEMKEYAKSCIDIPA